jgi:hypothetical protein
MKSGLPNAFPGSMESLTESVAGALIISTVLMAISAVNPTIGALIGAALLIMGVVSLVYAYLGDLESGYFFGTVFLVFGLLIEFASVDTLVKLVVVAIIVDAIVVLAKPLVEKLEEL